MVAVKIVMTGRPFRRSTIATGKSWRRAVGRLRRRIATASRSFHAAALGAGGRADAKRALCGGPDVGYAWAKRRGGMELTERIWVYRVGDRPAPKRCVPSWRCWSRMDQCRCFRHQSLTAATAMRTITRRPSGAARSPFFRSRQAVRPDRRACPFGSSRSLSSRRTPQIATRSCRPRVRGQETRRSKGRPA